MGSMSGTVRAGKPYEYAQVYLKNTDRHVMYTVYAVDGRFRATTLFPGTYEVSARAKGLESEVQTVTVAAGGRPTVSIEMDDALDADQPAALTDIGNLPIPVEPGGRAIAARIFATYDEIYPPGPGKEVAEQVCMVCHGENYLPSMPATEKVWQERIDFMMGRNLTEHDRPTGGGEGYLAPPASMWRFGLQDRKDLLAYLVKNFGPDAPVRAVRTAVPPPIDKARLAKAMYMEYYLPTANRRLFGMDFDEEGNVWAVNMSVPKSLVKINPRTGESKEFPLPDPEGGAAEIALDRQGMAWLPQFTMGQQALIKPPRLLYGFNMKTEKWEKQINLDPDDTVRATIKTPYAPTVDSQGNVWVGWIVGDALSKYDPRTGKVTIWRIPYPMASPYGVVADKRDKIWMGMYNTGGIIKFDPRDTSFTTYAPLTWPSYTRRGPSLDINGDIWSGVWAVGKQPGKILRISQESGKITEWTIPYQGAQPYHTGSDAKGNIWFIDNPTPDRGAGYGMFNPNTGTFAYYPKPHFGDTAPYVMPSQGGMWYAPRSAGFAGVLYPDMDAITSLRARPIPK